MTLNKEYGKPRVGQTGCFTYLNEFGRDSLRMILERLKNKRFLVPDLYCPIIIELMDTLKVRHQFYHIKDDLTIDWDSVNSDDYDVFYHIRYSETVSLEDKILLEDNVFHKDFELRTNKHIAFNSWRKCTPLTSGSLIKSTMKLKETYWKLQPEQLALLLSCDETQYDHYLVKDRDAVQAELASHNIFLPVFWRGCPNKLSEQIISIPIDDRYTHDETEFVKGLLCQYQ